MWIGTRADCKKEFALNSIDYVEIWTIKLQGSTNDHGNHIEEFSLMLTERKTNL